MKLLKRNTVEFQYYKNTGLSSDLDGDGYHTGEFHPVFAEPVTYRGTLSTPTGNAIQAFDGLEIRYSHTMVMDDPDADIKETGEVECNDRLYDIKAVRPSRNFLLIALQEKLKDASQDDYSPDDEHTVEPDIEPDIDPYDPGADTGPITGETGATGETGVTDETVVNAEPESPVVEEPVQAEGD